MAKVFVEDGLGVDLNVGLHKLSGGSFKSFKSSLQIPANASLFSSTAMIFEMTTTKIARSGVKSVQKRLLDDAMGLSRDRFNSINFEKVFKKVRRSRGRKTTTEPCLLNMLDDKFPLDLCPPRVREYREHFEANKDRLVKELQALFNKKIFSGQLGHVDIKWNDELQEKWGVSYDEWKKGLRTSRIELSTILCKTPGHVRDTLVHEMCHSAAWLLSKVHGAHGPAWAYWTEIAMRKFPALPYIAIKG